MVELTHAPIEIASLLAPAPSDGAVAIFVGTVRNHNQGRKVTHLEYEAFEEMALPLLAEIEQETRSRWPITEVRVVHRLGTLQIGDASVVVVATSPHRAEAFAACRHIIDALKARVPIWKKEHYVDGTAWVDGACPPQGSVR